MKRVTKKCPRCGEKNLEQALKCSDCGLVFSRMELATNKAAKKMIKQGQKDKVVYVKSTPKDLKRWKLILLTIFTGLWGGHLFYVGRYNKAIFMLIFGLIYIVGGILSISNLLSKGIEMVVYFCVGILGFCWLFDVLDVCIFRLKIPVYIDTEVTK